MIRTFIAIDLPPSVQGALNSLTKELQEIRAPITWVKPERIHLTLKFLGDVAEEQIAVIQNNMAQVAQKALPFRLEPLGCGAFPSLKEMRVIWVGLATEGPGLYDLQQAVEEALMPMGFKKEPRPFKPHLTLGRVKGRQHLRPLQNLLIKRQSFRAEAFDVRELVLYKSELRPEGARYTCLFRNPLIGGILASTIQD